MKYPIHFSVKRVIDFSNFYEFEDILTLNGESLRIKIEAMKLFRSIFFSYEERIQGFLNEVFIGVEKVHLKDIFDIKSKIEEFPLACLCNEIIIKIKRILRKVIRQEELDNSEEEVEVRGYGRFKIAFIEAVKLNYISMLKQLLTFAYAPFLITSEGPCGIGTAIKNLTKEKVNSDKEICIEILLDFADKNNITIPNDGY